MKSMARWTILLAVGTSAWAAEEFTRQQLEARFYYDLGPAEIDVSSYPEKQREDYLVFKRVCSQCHTLARPINAPLTRRRDWERYVRRMHLRSKERTGARLTWEEAGVIADFLAYDSHRRKAEQKAEFQAKDLELRRLYEEARKERARLILEEDRKKARPAPPYTGTK